MKSESEKIRDDEDLYSAFDDFVCAHSAELGFGRERSGRARISSFRSRAVSQPLLRKKETAASKTP